MKTKIFISISLSLVFLVISCSDFLEEDNKTGMTDDVVYTTETSVENLVAACYSYLRYWYGKEAAFYIAEAGTDLWYDGKDCYGRDLVTYRNVTPDLGVGLPDYWELFYNAINLCNLAEQKLDEHETMSTANKVKNLSEVRFLRAFYYWHLVETWGPVQLNLEPVTAPSTVAYRHPVEKIYDQMVKDVQYAIDNLSPAEDPNSRVTHWAAKAFMARIALYYASEYGKTEYYAKAATLAKDVINNSGKKLYDNYKDVWDQFKSTTTLNDEFIWAVDYYNEITNDYPYNHGPARLTWNSTNYSGDWSALLTRIGNRYNLSGNAAHTITSPIWNSLSDATGGAGITDVLVRVGGANKFYTAESPNTKVSVDVGYFYVKYGMGYSRGCPTRYCMDIFDETMDQRYNGSFRSAWYKHPNVVPKGYGTSSCAYPNMSVGTETDTVVWYSKRPLTEAQKAWAKGRYKVLDVNNTFLEDGITPNNVTTSTGSVYFFINMCKFENYDSKIALPTSNFQDYFTYRDFPVFRISEMYLIAAEAEISSNQADAVTLINALRTKRAFPGKTAKMQVASVDLNFILEERAREFVGENMRWFDLKRTKKLKQQLVHNVRSYPYFDETKHYLRPIPAAQMNAVSNRAETETEGGFWQNPGY